MELLFGCKLRLLALGSQVITYFYVKKIRNSFFSFYSTGSHTHDKVAENIKQVMDEYGLPAYKVSHVVTDNGSNFVKAFKQFSVSKVLSKSFYLKHLFISNMNFVGRNKEISRRVC